PSDSPSPDVADGVADGERVIGFDDELLESGDPAPPRACLAATRALVPVPHGDRSSVPDQVLASLRSTAPLGRTTALRPSVPSVRAGPWIIGRPIESISEM